MAQHCYSAIMYIGVQYSVPITLSTISPNATLHICSGEVRKGTHITMTLILETFKHVLRFQNAQSPIHVIIHCTYVPFLRVNLIVARAWLLRANMVTEQSIK